jgi:acetyl esterase/lipase
VYTPAPGNGASSRPVVLFFHPGGWIAGSLDVADNPCRRLAAELDAIVVSAGYPLAPEHPFPAATDATFAAVQWAREHIAEYGGDPDRIAVMGESAGANLAAVAAVRARDAGIELAAQVLLYPPIDPNASTPSRAEFADGPFLSVAAADAMWAAYLAGAEVTPLAAPSRNDDLSGLAPALVLTLECDPTRDEAEDYARVLGEAGVAVEHHRLDGLIHGVFNMSAIVPRVDEIHTIINRFLTETFARAAAPA